MRCQLCVALARQSPGGHRARPDSPTAPDHSVAGDLGINDAALRQALHQRGILTVGIPKTMSPFSRIPVLRKSATSSLRRACTASAPRTKCTWPVPVAIAARWWKATSPACFHAVRARYVTKVLEGAMRQQGMTVMAHNGAALVRIRQRHLSKRAQKFRRLMGLRHRKH